jgi:hypothetical protein
MVYQLNIVESGGEENTRDVPRRWQLKNKNKKKKREKVERELLHLREDCHGSGRG